MINIKHLSFRLSVGLTILAFTLCQASLPTQAQKGNQSDVTGLNVTNSAITGGIFAPSAGNNSGGSSSFSGSVGAAVSQAATTVSAELSSSNSPAETSVSSLASGSSSPSDDASMAATLGGGEGGSPAAKAAAANLVSNMSGIWGDSNHARIKVDSSELLAAVTTDNKAQLKTTSRISKKSQIKVNPAKLFGAINAYNDLINNSSAEFLKNPPPQLLVIRSVLLQLIKPLLK